jgi:restriction system protein
VLKAYASGEEIRTGHLIALLSDQLRLSEEDKNQRVPGGSKSILAANVGFAKADLLRAGLVRDAGGGFYTITDRGKEVLIEKPAAIDRAFLRQFPEFAGLLCRNIRKSECR